jgi:hypothetical protein
MFCTTLSDPFENDVSARVVEPYVRMTSQPAAAIESERECVKFVFSLGGHSHTFV